MGLDITVIERIEPIPDEDLPRIGPEGDRWGGEPGEIDWEACYEQGIRQAMVYGGFEHSARGLELRETKTVSGFGGDTVLHYGAFYRGTGETFGFRAGSYSGYGQFREALRELVGAPPFGEVIVGDGPWAAAIEQPFGELIYFADNEGTIGPEAAANLAKDFEEWRRKAVSEWSGSPEGDYYLARYEDWAHGCKLAAGTGMIVFH